MSKGAIYIELFSSMFATPKIGVKNQKSELESNSSLNRVQIRLQAAESLGEAQCVLRLCKLSLRSACSDFSKKSEI